jgi:hypothetical protein
MESLKIAYAKIQLEKVSTAIHKLSPECVVKINECLELLKKEEKKYPPYTGQELTCSWNFPDLKDLTF